MSLNPSQFGQLQMFMLPSEIMAQYKPKVEED